MDDESRVVRRRCFREYTLAVGKIKHAPQPGELSRGDEIVDMSEYRPEIGAAKSFYLHAREVSVKILFACDVRFIAYPVITLQYVEIGL